MTSYMLDTNIVSHVIKGVTGQSFAAGWLLFRWRRW